MSDVEYRALAEFRYQLRLFFAFSERAARDAGLNPQQHQLLLAVRGFAPDTPTIADLAERLMLRHHSIVELVDRLESRRLVRRLRSKEDRRRIQVVISAAGERVLDRLSRAHRDELAKSGPELIGALDRVLREHAS
jgi:DNA-binding MarR family transcriptional regulator